MEKKLRCIIWAAVSTQIQAEDERFSLPKQIEDARAIIEKRDWQEIDCLVVPGHSRRYYTLLEVATETKKAGIDAFDRLARHLEAKDFDVFICRGGDRFGREQSLVAEITGRINDAGAQIYALDSGDFVSPKNRRMWSAFTGLQAAADIDKLVEFRRAGLIEKAKRGLTAGKKAPLSHKIIRNETGKMISIAPDETTRRLFEDAAALLLDGVAWNRLEIELYERFGHVNPSTGKPFTRTMLYQMIMTPTFWGHGAYGHRPKRGHWEFGMWVMDNTTPHPNHVEVFYNTHEPMLTGELAEKVKAEIRRRSDSIKGRANPNRTGIFTGLIVCGDCWRNAALRHTKRKNGIDYYYGCLTNYVPQWKTENNRRCANSAYIRVEQAIKEINDKLLLPLHAGIDLETVLSAGSSQDDIRRHIGEIEGEIKDRQEQARRLIRLQATASETIASMYSEELEQIGETLKRLQRRFEELRSLGEVMTETQRRAAEDVLALSIEDFWRQGWTNINQQLHRLLGNRRFVLEDGHLIAIMRKTNAS